MLGPVKVSSTPTVVNFGQLIHFGSYLIPRLSLPRTPAQSLHHQCQAQGCQGACQGRIAGCSQGRGSYGHGYGGDQSAGHPRTTSALRGRRLCVRALRQALLDLVTTCLDPIKLMQTRTHARTHSNEQRKRTRIVDLMRQGTGAIGKVTRE